MLEGPNSKANSYALGPEQLVNVPAYICDHISDMLQSGNPNVRLSPTVADMKSHILFTFHCADVSISTSAGRSCFCIQVANYVLFQWASSMQLPWVAIV